MTAWGGLQTQALAGASAAFGIWLSDPIGSGDAGFAYAVLGLQRRTFGAWPGYALDRLCGSKSGYHPAAGRLLGGHAGLDEGADTWTEQGAARDRGS